MAKSIFDAQKCVNVPSYSEGSVLVVNIEKSDSVFFLPI